MSGLSENIKKKKHEQYNAVLLVQSDLLCLFQEQSVHKSRYI